MVLTAGAVLVLAPWLASCGGEPPASAALRRDSAGVTLVESMAPAWGPSPPWALDSVPRLDLAVVDTGAAHRFSRVGDATVLPDGRLVVLDEESHQVRIFGSDGAFLHAMGREGEGPGDFDRMTDVFAVRGDSIAVFDSWLGRVTILDGDGELGRVLTLPTELQYDALEPLDGEGFLAVTWSFDEFAATSGVYRAEYVVLTVSAAGKLGDTVAVVPGWNGYKSNQGDRYVDYGLPFPLQGRISANGHGMVAGGGEAMEFRRWAPGGRLAQLVRVPSLDEPLTADEIRAERASMLRPGSSAEYRRLVESLPVPRVRPAYDDLKLDAEGFVWVARYHSLRRERDDPRTWQVFAPDGTWLGSLVTPARFEVFEIGRDYVLGVRRDALDVEHPQLLPLTR